MLHSYLQESKIFGPRSGHMNLGRPFKAGKCGKTGVRRVATVEFNRRYATKSFSTSPFRALKGPAKLMRPLRGLLMSTKNHAALGIPPALPGRINLLYVDFFAIILYTKILKGEFHGGHKHD
jgi:hypothetical protein